MYRVCMCVVAQDEFRRLHSERRRKTVKATPTLRRSSHKGGALSISVDQRNDEADSADPAFAERVHVAGVADSDLPAPPADLNDLLRVFGAWLFDAALDDRKGVLWPVACGGTLTTARLTHATLCSVSTRLRVRPSFGNRHLGAALHLAWHLLR